MEARRRWLAVVLLACAGCARSSDSIDLVAAFSDDTVVGEITVSWQDGGEEREGADRNATERRLTFRVDAHNRLAGPLYVRLRDLRLIGPDGPVPIDDSVACTLDPGTSAGLLHGGVWVPATQVTAMRGFRVDPFAVPLSERGRAFYREFLLSQRPGEAVAIDAALAALAAAPRCTGDHQP